MSNCINHSSFKKKLMTLSPSALKKTKHCTFSHCPTGCCEPSPPLLRPFARHLEGKMVIQTAHECSSTSTAQQKKKHPLRFRGSCLFQNLHVSATLAVSGWGRAVGGDGTHVTAFPKSMADAASCARRSITWRSLLDNNGGRDRFPLGTGWEKAYFPGWPVSFREG